MELIRGQDSDGTREKIVSDFYDWYIEDDRLERSIHGRLEYATTMHYIHRFAGANAKVLEVGAGTGRYSIALAKEGMNVSSIELVQSNYERLKKNCEGIENIEAFQGDATDLGRFADSSFDLTLVFGPMYHLYEKEDVDKAIDESIRVTKPGGTIMFAFISVFAIMYSNYFYGNWADGQKENFTEDYKVRHFKEQLFTGYDVTEFEGLFKGKEVDWITTTGVDGLIEPIEDRSDFSISDKDFEALSKWYLAFSEKRELLGNTNHLLYICKKNNMLGGRYEN
jgi:ubiquinone/menaquinone biosynthesis C-methylase UbiE